MRVPFRVDTLVTLADWGKDEGVWYRCPGDLAPQPMLWSNYLHCQHNAVLGRRGLVLSPYGGLGNHRYPQVGSGDTPAAWSTLAFEVYSTLTAANVLTPWTHDLGGFHQTAYIWPTAELWIRWVQFGVFSPSFRTHCAKEGACEPWDFAQQPVWTAAFQLRNALMPYVYSASYAAYFTGVSIAHPLYYDYPEDEESYVFAEQYLFGDAMLVAPVVDLKEVPKAIWLPSGAWYPWCQHANSPLIGPLLLTNQTFALDEIPVYVRAGSIIATKTMADAPALPVAPTRLVLLLFPGATTSTAQVYEDDGEGLAYQSGAFRVLTIVQERLPPQVLSVFVTPTGQGYASEADTRAFSFQFLGVETLPQRVTLSVDGGPATPMSPTSPGTPPGYWLTQQGVYPALEVALFNTTSTSTIAVQVFM